MSSNTGSIALFGECMIELKGTLFGSLTQAWGGDTYNTAVYVRRLLPDDFSVRYVTALGDDAHSKYMRTAWEEQGLVTDAVATIAGKRPGLYQISVDDSGERSFSYWRNDAAVKYVFDDVSVADLVDRLSQFEWFYLSGISLAVLTPAGRKTLLSALQIYNDQGGNVVFDNNFRPALWESKALCQEVYREVLSYTKLALLTLDDEQALWETSTPEEVFSMWSCDEVVIKCGAEACWVRASGVTSNVPAIKAERVVDTTAAGDSFGAGYLAGRLTGKTPEQSCTQGHRLASTVIQYSGAIIPVDAMPTRV